MIKLDPIPIPGLSLPPPGVGKLLFNGFPTTSTNVDTLGWGLEPISLDGYIWVTFVPSLSASGGGQYSTDNCRTGKCQFSFGTKISAQGQIQLGFKVGPIASANVFGKTGVDGNYSEKADKAEAWVTFTGFTVGWTIEFASGLIAAEEAYTIVQPKETERLNAYPVVQGLLGVELVCR